MRYIITGGPCTGKTTLLERLAKEGFLTLPESARQIIAEEQTKRNGILPWTDMEQFQYNVIARQIENERQLSGGVCFLDRGIVDSLAYMEKEGIRPSNQLYSQMKGQEHSLVFLLEPLDCYRVDSERKESRTEASIIQNHLYDAYSFLGYNIVRVPNLGVDERVKFVLETIKKYGGK